MHVEEAPLAPLPHLAGYLERDAALGGELAGVAEEVQQTLPDFGQIGVHQAHIVSYIEGKRIRVVTRGRLYRAPHLFEQTRDVKGLQIQSHLPSLDLREVEDVINERQEVLTGAMNFAEVGERRVLPEGFCILDQHLAI